MSSISRRAFLGSTAAIAGAAGLGVADERDAGDQSKIGKTPHSRFAPNIEMWFKKLPVPDRIRQASALGFPAVEFWPWKGKDVDAIARLTQELGIAIAQFSAWSFKPGLNDPRNHDAFATAVRDGCRVAHQLHCKLMTVVAGDDIPGLSHDEMHANVIQGLKRAAPIAEGEDVTLILEPLNIRVEHKGHCLYGSAPAIRICNEVGSSHVKINWDLYHMQITEGDLCGHLREGFAAGRIGYLQLADHPGRHEPGTGEICYSRVLKEAHDLGYRGYIGLELSPLSDELAAAKAVANADVW